MKKDQFNKHRLRFLITLPSPVAHLDSYASTGKQLSPLLFPVLLFKGPKVGYRHLVTNARRTISGVSRHVSLWLSSEKHGWENTSQKMPSGTILRVTKRGNLFFLITSLKDLSMLCSIINRSCYLNFFFFKFWVANLTLTN